MPFFERAGARVHYTVGGSGPPVLLIQGVGVIGEGWRPQIDGLADRFTLVAFDNRGIGGSSIPGNRFTIEDLAADAAGLMQSLGYGRFHVAGHSMGGLVAQEIALAAPGRVASLALLCTFAHGRQGARMTPALALTAIRMRLGTKAMRRNAFVELVMPEPHSRTTDRAALAERLRPLFGRDLADNPPIVMKQVFAMARYDARARLPAVGGIPVMVISAAYDRIALPAFGRELAGAIPGARYIEIADAGHGVTIQKAEEVNLLLARHFVEAERAARNVFTPPSAPQVLHS